MKRLVLAVVSTALWTSVALASPPQDIADLAGARAAGGETQMFSRGYAPARTKGLTAYWWNDATSTCARVITGNGRYKTVDTAKASDCGKAAPGKAAATTGAAAGVPQAARNACAQRADQFQNATPGSSSVDAAAKAGQNWVLKMATGEYRSTCTVTATGKVVSIDPG